MWQRLQDLPSGRESGETGYDDSTALLTGSLGSTPNSGVAKRSTSPFQSGGRQDVEEVEIRLRSSLSAHSCTGYEVIFRALKSAESYVEIVRVERAQLGEFSYVARREGVQVGIADGDMVKASVIGNLITVYINNVQVLQATDNTYSSGSPWHGVFSLGSDRREQRLWIHEPYGFGLRTPDITCPLLMY